MGTSRLKIGDCFQIPLPDGRSVFCQYVVRHKLYGALIRVFDLFSSESSVPLDQLKTAKLLFPPVFVGLLASARSGRWRKIGNLPVENFTFPLFRSTMGTKPGVYHDWKIWDGENTEQIGDLPPNLSELELKCVWGDEGLEERIVDGTYRGAQMH